MRILFTICGRAGSKGIKNKNLINFAGRPLAFYSISVIDLFLKKNTTVEYDICINSDSYELLRLLRDNHMRSVECITREICLAGDTVGKIDVIRNCLDVMCERMNEQYDMVVDLDITSPLRKVSDLENLINKHIEKQSDVTMTVTRARRNPYFNQVKETECGVKRVIDSKYTARQQAPEVYDMNASIYAYNPAYLKSKGEVLDGYCEMIEMYDTGVLDLDHENDLELMEVIAKYLYSINAEFAEIRENIV